MEPNGDFVIVDGHRGRPVDQVAEDLPCLGVSVAPHPSCHEAVEAAGDDEDEREVREARCGSAEVRLDGSREAGSIDRRELPRELLHAKRKRESRSACRNRLSRKGILERDTRLELATSTLAR